jgi:hypothetical protein
MNEFGRSVESFLQKVSSLSGLSSDAINSLAERIMLRSSELCIFIDKRGRKCGHPSVTGYQYCSAHFDTPSCGGYRKITGICSGHEKGEEKGEEKEEEYTW